SIDDMVGCAAGLVGVAVGAGSVDVAVGAGLVGVGVGSGSVATPVTVNTAPGVAVRGSGVQVVVAGDAGTVVGWTAAHPTTRVTASPAEKITMFAPVSFLDILGPRSHPRMGQKTPFRQRMPHRYTTLS
ncbi:MAG: hypothetical protein PVF04_05745, partial [Anaerolineae bacterium]